MKQKVNQDGVKLVLKEQQKEFQKHMMA